MDVAFRVDASRQIGTGHFMRCLTLADGLRECGVRVRFVSRQMPDHLEKLLMAAGHELARLHPPGAAGADAGIRHAGWLGTSQERDADDTVAVLSGRRWDWMVVDHYSLDARWETTVRAAAGQIAAIDDIADRAHDCDLLLDQNMHPRSEQRYAGKVPGRGTLLLGPRYALLRKEFRTARESLRVRGPDIGRILVFFGGADASDRTSGAVEALAGLGLPFLKADVVVGLSHPNRDRIAAQCSRHGYLLHVQTEHMAELIAAADLGIGAGGSATWERCCLGLATLAFCTADNQREQLEAAACAGLVYAPAVTDSDWIGAVRRHVMTLIENPPLRQALSAAGMRSVDGLGTMRMLEALGATLVDLRRAGPEDSRRLFQWRNHASIRAVSRHGDPIEWETHCRWLSKTLDSPDHPLLIGELNGAPVGVVRFDVKGEEAEISIYLVPVSHPPGRGRQLLRSAEKWLGAHRPGVSTIRAVVMGGNERSARLFLGAGYRSDEMSYSKRLQ